MADALRTAFTDAFSWENKMHSLVEFQLILLVMN